MTDEEKKAEVESISRKYGKRRGFKTLLANAQRELYKKDLYQPFQREFKDVYRNQTIIKENQDRLIDATIERKQKELDEAYQEKPKNVVTVEEKTLRDVQKEHPKMISQEDILRWS